MDKQFESIPLETSARKSLLENDVKFIFYFLLNQNKQEQDENSSTAHIILKTSPNENETSVIEVLKLKRQSIIKNLDSLPQSIDCTNGASIISSKVLFEILNYDLKSFYEERLRERRSFFRRISTENIMKWDNKELTQPLTKLSKEFESVSIQIFRNLQSYMNDRKSNKGPIDHVKKYLKLTMNSAEEIRDEAYVQILKQIKGHKYYEKALRGWNFLAIVASCFIPSMKLFYSILNYLLFEIKNNSDKTIVSHANYILVRLYKTFELKRKNIPSEDEIIHIEKMKQILVPIYFFQNSLLKGEIESYTTVKELKTNVMKKMNFNSSKIPYFCLYETCNTKDKIEERYLEDSERVADILSLWAQDIDDYFKKKEHIDFKIYIKIFLNYSYPSSDIDTMTAEFSQSVYDVNGGKFNLKESEAISLAALQLVSDCGKNEDGAYQNIQKNLDKYIPLNMINLNPHLYYAEKIMEYYSQFKTSSKLEVKKMYLELLAKSPLWQAHQFFAKFSKKNLDNPENLPEDIIIGIKPNGLSFYDLERNELLYYPYHIIANWGISSQLLVLNVAKTDSQTIKHYLETNQLKIIQQLLESYTNLIAGKSIAEVQNITTDSAKRFVNMNTGRVRSGTNFCKITS